MDSYIGNLFDKTKLKRPKRYHRGTLIIDDTMVFLYDDGNKVEINYTDIVNVTTIFPLDRPQFQMKEGQMYVFCGFPPQSIGTRSNSIPFISLK